MRERRAERLSWLMDGGKEIRVICCGNLFASDDGVGPAIAERLRSLGLPENVRVIDAGTPGLGILEMMKGARKVIFVDATLTGAKPGTVRKLDLGELESARKGMGVSLHEFPLADALRMAREIGLEAPVEIVVIGIEAGSIEKPRIGLSREVERALPEALEAVLFEIKN
ncbi:MAG: hydrogenase maturation protease [Candidatus Brockarchaeota archaeon]|nr:hydrogenase maturation protease [Candidatus Brockarchaeota archaeon]